MEDQAPEVADENPDLDAAVDAALALADGDENTQAEAEDNVSAREAAELEERLAVEAIASARQNGDDAGAAEENAIQQTTLIGAAAKGRDHLLQKMREHSANTAAKAAYVPPPLTDRQRERLEMEMAAGKRANAKAQAQADFRPVPPKDKSEGYSTPVHRPANVVPDPKLTATPFAAGTKQYSPDV